MDPLDHILARFEREYLDVNSATELRRREQLRILRRFASGLDHPLEELTAADLTAFVGAEMARGVHPNTATKYLNMIRAFVTWGRKAKVIGKKRTKQLQSVRKPRGATYRTKPKPYKAFEVQRFYAVMAAKYPRLPETGLHSHALFVYQRGKTERRLVTKLWRHARRLQFEAQVALALEEGLRRKEISELTIPALHPENDQIVVVTAKQLPGMEIRRAIPYTEHARKVVAEWLELRKILAPEHEHPWLTLHGAAQRFNGEVPDQLSAQDIQAMEEALTVFGPGWRWHRFRHTAATMWLRAGVPLEQVRIFMGHANLEQTLAYAEIVKSDIQAQFGVAEKGFMRQLGFAGYDEPGTEAAA